MKIINPLKRLAILVLVLASVAGCAGSKPKETQIANKADASTDVSSNSDRNGSGSYTVVSGDNLWNIAASSSIYGDPYKWPLIYKANKSRISDADLIYTGQVFEIDQSPSSVAINAAVNHAKTRGAWSVGSVEVSDTRYLAR